MPAAGHTAATHSIVESNGIRIHVVEEGEGPLVLLVHGFPESWYSWRHQLPALADAGYRGAAVDVRGYGRSSKPAAIDEYRMLALVGDIVGLIPALGEETAFIVGHDWGSPITANSCLLRPDLFRGMALLSVPYSPHSSTSPLTAFRDAPSPADGKSMATVERGGQLRDHFAWPEKLPPWLGEDDLDFYVAEF